MPDAQSITAFSSVASFITSIAAIGTVIAQIVISRANRKAAHRLEMSKLFFSSKASAYRDFLLAVQNFDASPEPTSYPALQTACSYAALFSDSATSKILHDYGLWATRYRLSQGDSKIYEGYKLSQDAAVDAMRLELNHLQLGKN